MWLGKRVRGGREWRRRAPQVNRVVDFFSGVVEMDKMDETSVLCLDVIEWRTAVRKRGGGKTWVRGRGARDGGH